MKGLSSGWLVILSELLVNVASGWFAVVFIEPTVSLPLTIKGIALSVARVSLGVSSLFLAKRFREASSYE